MSYRYGGRVGVNLENEQRRLQREPVAVWKKEWVVPAGAPPQTEVKVLKYVRTADVIRFDEEDHAIDDATAVMELDASVAAQTPPVAAGALLDDPLQQTATDSHDDDTMADMSVAAATAVLEAAEEAEPSVSAPAQGEPAASLSLGSGLSLDGGAAARDTPPVALPTQDEIAEQTTTATEPVEAASLHALMEPSVAMAADVTEEQPQTVDLPTDAAHAAQE